MGFLLKRDGLPGTQAKAVFMSAVAKQPEFRQYRVFQKESQPGSLAASDSVEWM